MERNLWEYVEWGGFEEFSAEELEASFEEKEGRFAQGIEEMKALRWEESGLRRVRLERMKIGWD